MVLIKGRYYPPKHFGRDTLSSGKRGYVRRQEERRTLIAAGVNPDTVKTGRVNPKKACPERGDTL